MSRRWFSAVSAVFLSGFGVWILPHHSASAGVSEPAGQLPIGETASSADLLWMSVKVILALVFILALILLSIKALAAKRRSWFVSSHFRPLGGIPLGTGKSLQLIQIGRSIYIIGVDNEIRLIDKIKDEEEIRELLEPDDPQRSGEKFPSSAKWGMQGLWKRAASYIASIRLKRENVPENGGEEMPTFQQIFDGKLKELSNRSQLLEERLAEEKEKAGTNGEEQKKERDRT